MVSSLSAGCIAGPGVPFVRPSAWRHGLGAPVPISAAHAARQHERCQPWQQSLVSDGLTSIVCQATSVPSEAEEMNRKKLTSMWKKQAVPDIKEAHKVFDEVVITVKSGDGGQGEVIQSGKGRWVPNLKYRPGGNQPKKIWLNSSEPGDGADGADVVLVCDPALDNLLHLHARKQYTAPKGSNANPSLGSAGPKNNKDVRKAITPPFEIPVPPGTVIKRKGTGALLGEIMNPGDRLVVARGGRGGTGVVVQNREQKLDKQQKQMARARKEGTEVVEVEDRNWKLDAAGAPGQQLSLNLLLRVVADVGIVGLPNAGKSSLLRSMTNASPTIAPYPFTTLMPNLGVLAAGGAHKTVLADLPGLIEGAHEGKGLGRMFLRHLRRTRALLHVVDASLPDPQGDYYTVREELRMYNPEYCGRPHVVVLNKIDLLDGSADATSVVQGVLQAAERHCKQWAKEELVPLPPAAVVTTSAATGYGLGELNKALNHSLRPGCAKELTNKGTAATLLFTNHSAPPTTPTVASAGAGDRTTQQVAAAAAAIAAAAAAAGAVSQGLGLKDHGEEEASRRLQFFNSKVQGSDAWSGAHILAGGGPSEGEDPEGDGGPEEPLAPLDVEDAWLFELTDNQLLRLVDQDDVRAAFREQSSLAAGKDPYAVVEEVVKENMGGDGSGQGQEADKAGTVGGEAVMVEKSEEGGEAEEDDDEWVELSAEELKLLAFLDEHERLEQLGQLEEDGMAGEVGSAPKRGEDAGQGEDSDPAWKSKVDRLCDLSDAQLEAMADEGDSWGCEGDGMSGQMMERQGSGGAEASQDDQEEEVGLDEKDKALLQLSDEELERLVEEGDTAWEGQQ